MSSASNKFKLLVESGKWMALSDDQAKILALEAQVNKFAIKGKSSNTSSISGKSSPQKKGSGKSSRNSGPKKPIPAWMTKWPGKDFVDANKTKLVEGRTYWWCRHHKRFCMHQTNQCKMAKSKASGPGPSASSPSGTPSNDSSPTPSIRVSTASMMDE